MSSSKKRQVSQQETKQAKQASKRSTTEQDVIEFRLVSGQLLVNGWCQVLVELGMMECNQDCDTCWCG
uniref:Uncharacterized protein n=1 Tax=viral metagenome TaxID=1070528 RepID=A0A6M3Y0T2_9ZZZZ